MTPPLRIALVGCGRMGRAHLAAAAGVSEVEVVAVCDPLLDGRARQSVGVPVRDFDEVTESPAIDAVLIAAPTPLHARLVAVALDRGKHVLCEKPLTLDPPSDHALAAQAEACGRVLQVGFWRRFAEPYVRLRRMLRRGRIGAVTGLRMAQWDASPPSPAFCDPRVSGGIEIDCGVHEFDLARWLLAAEVRSVAAAAPTASAALGAVGDVDTVFGLATLHDGRALTIDLTRTAGHRDSIRTEVIGERGTIVAEFADVGSLVLRCGRRRATFGLAVRDVIADALRRQLCAFAEGVHRRRRHPEAATARDSGRALVAARALREARETGRWHIVADESG